MTDINALTAEIERLRSLAEWVLIDAEHLPKVGDELGGYDRACAIPSWIVRVATRAFMNGFSVDQCLRMSYTHYRPINAPPRRSEAAPVN
jgi:hypothetical protein